MSRSVIFATAGLLGAACAGSDYQLSPVQPEALLLAPPASYDFAPVPDPPDGSALEVEEDERAQLRRERFSFGGEELTPLADYLFVVDDSVSMESVIDPLRQGFSSLAHEGVFPPRSRIAVMNTQPGDYQNLQRWHPTVLRSWALRGSPGFLRLVDGDALESYRQRLGPERAGLFAHRGCQAWFAPQERGAGGVSCLEAHTQIGLVAYRAEAGLHAFKQLLLVRGEQPLFRPGAAANVIFVSDTHDPGFQPSQAKPELDAQLEDLYARQPDFDELQELVLAANLVSSFRVHAIAPQSLCSEPWLEPSYFDVTEQSGGVSLDICVERDYAPLVREIVRSGALQQQPLFALSVPAAAVETVLVDGEAVSFTLEGERVLALDLELPGRRADVEVVYHKRGSRGR